MCHLCFSVYHFGVSHSGLRRMGKFYPIIASHFESSVWEWKWNLWATPCLMFCLWDYVCCLYVCQYLHWLVETSLVNKRAHMWQHQGILPYCVRFCLWQNVVGIFPFGLALLWVIRALFQLVAPPPTTPTRVFLQNWEIFNYAPMKKNWHFSPVPRPSGILILSRLSLEKKT